MVSKSAFFYRLFRESADATTPKFIGSAFAIAPDGGLLTCRHVVDQQLDEDEFISVLDEQVGRRVRVEQITYPPDAAVDAAFLPEALKRHKEEFLPLISPETVKVGEDVYSFGFFQSSDGPEEGYFSGRIVNFTKRRGLYSLTLPYPIVEGLSGSPVLTYHNGPKVVGMAYGSRSTRILASEILELHDDGKHYEETVHRVVEFGLAYHVATLIDEVIQGIGIPGAIMSSERLSIPHLE